MEPTTARRSIELDRDERNPLEVLTTNCCGVRYRAKTAPDVCLMCARPIAKIEVPTERVLEPKNFGTTRYWS